MEDYVYWGLFLLFRYHPLLSVSGGVRATTIAPIFRVGKHGCSTLGIFRARENNDVVSSLGTCVVLADGSFSRNEYGRLLIDWIFSGLV